MPHVTTLFVVLALLTPHGDAAQEPEIFREISIQPYGSIALGAAFAQADSLGEQLAPNVYLLPPGFDATLGIAVVLDPNENVQALIFEYGPNETFDGMVRDYTEMLGDPAGTLIMKVTDQANSSYLCTYWQDQRTRFEVVQRPFADVNQLFSVMHDRVRPLEEDVCAISTYFRDTTR